MVERIRPNMEDSNEPKDVGPIGQIGLNGSSVFPGEAADQIRKSGAAKFRPFPSLGLKSGSSILDRERVRREFMASPIEKWEPFCASMGYDPDGIKLSPRDWERDKKYKRGWNKIRKELEDHSTELGPNILLQAVKAASKVPESLASMLEVCRFKLNILLSEAAHDQAAIAQAGGYLPPDKRRFSATPGDISSLASALKTTSESLFKALGIESTTGIDVEKWGRTIENTLGKLDALDRGQEKTDIIEVEIMGTGDVRDTLREAMEKYLDKPRIVNDPPEKEVLDDGEAEAGPEQL